MVGNKFRPWVARVQYPGLDKSLAGNIMMPAEAQSHEVEAALKAHFDTFLPPGWVMIEPLCGAIFFVPEEDLK